jgi:hypothetical protein
MKSDQSCSSSQRWELLRNDAYEKNSTREN